MRACVIWDSSDCDLELMEFFSTALRVTQSCANGVLENVANGMQGVALISTKLIFSRFNFCDWKKNLIKLTSRHSLVFASLGSSAIHGLNVAFSATWKMHLGAFHRFPSAPPVFL